MAKPNGKLTLKIGDTIMDYDKSELSPNKITQPQPIPKNDTTVKPKEPEVKKLVHTLKEIIVTRMGNTPSPEEYSDIKQEYVDTPDFALCRYKRAVRLILKQKGYSDLPRTCTIQSTLDELLKLPYKT